MIFVFQAKVVEFYTPGRFFLLGKNPEVMEALQIITTELQNTYSFKPATSYMPCVGEVCAVQYSFDMVSIGSSGSIQEILFNFAYLFIYFF